MTRQKISVAVVLAFAVYAQAALGYDKAVVLVYHHVAGDTPPSTSVTTEEFEKHLDYLERNRFKVTSLETIVERLGSSASLPPRTVALTFDDAYESVFTNVRPALSARGWPFTVFVATNSIDRGQSPYMTWEQLQAIVNDGNHIGNHSAAHAHPHDQSLAEFKSDLNKAQRRIIEKTGYTPNTYAYPYGEFDEAQERIVAASGLAGIGQQSGAFGSRTPLTQVPRFPISSSFADIDAFALRVSASPLPLSAIAPRSRIRTAGESLPRLVLQLEDPAFEVASINCFYNGAPVDTELLRPDRFAIRPKGRIARGRSKYTCTALADADGSYAWYSHLWIAR